LGGPAPSDDVEEHARREDTPDQRPIPVVGADEELVDRLNDLGAIYQRFEFFIHFAIVDQGLRLPASGLGLGISEFALTLYSPSD
jgi:hypothetical protein